MLFDPVIETSIMKISIFICLAFSTSLLISCNPGTDKSSNSTSVSSIDSAVTGNVTDNMATTNSMNTDSTSASVAANASADTGTSAKPNSAKKGLKGTVTTTPGKKPAANANPEETDNQGYYTNIAPSFPGGDRAIINFFQKNIDYPEDAAANGVEGTVNISFLVDEKGNISYPMTNPPRIGYGLEEEAMRVFSKMPKWTPGSLKGKNVKTRYTLPVTFQLQ